MVRFQPNPAWRRNPRKMARAIEVLRAQFEKERAIAQDGRYTVEFLTTPTSLNWAVLDSTQENPRQTPVALYGYGAAGRDAALMRAYYMNEEDASDAA